VHFKPAGNAVLAAQVSRSIRRTLRQRFAGRPKRKAKASGKSEAGRRVPGWQPTRMEVYKQVGQVTLRLHVFEPDHHKASDRRPAIVFFFGGGWVGGTPAQFYPHCDYLAGRGMVAISAEYRIRNKHKTTPFECVEDGKSAVRFVRMNAHKLGIDANKIAAGGGSAGGHVAACTGVIAGLDDQREDLSISSRPAKLVLFNPVIDTGPQGFGHSRLGDRWEEISPQHHVRPGLPPTLIFHGTADTTVEYARVEAFRDAMLEAGNACTLVGVEGLGHGFFNEGRGDGAPYEATVLAMLEFLNEPSNE